VNGLADIFLYLLAAAIAVPIANRIGLGSVLGYLLAGVALGPALGLLGDNVEDVMHFSEFGVVMMLFLIGLELRPKVLWGMRRDLLGLGGLQMLGSALLLGAGAFAFGVDWQVAVAIGLILALSRLRRFAVSGHRSHSDSRGDAIACGKHRGTSWR